MLLKNYENVVEKTVDIWMETEAQMLSYQMDVLLYVEDGVGKVELFPNVGGNSWLDDDSILLVSVKPIYSGFEDLGVDAGYEEIMDYLSEYRQEYIDAVVETLKKNGYEENWG